MAELEVIDVVGSVAPEQMQDRASAGGAGVISEAPGSITYTVESPADGDLATPEFSIQATVSLDPAIGVQIQEPGRAGQAISMQLDPGQEASAGTLVASDAVAFETAGDTKTLVLVKEDANVQFLTTIAGPQDPSEFVFNVGLPPGAVAEHAADGAIRFVVADAWLGKAIWESTSLSPLSGCSYQGGTLVCSRYRINLTLTQWGFNSGTLVLNDAGWDEARNKQPRITRYATSKDQYNCHALGYFPSGEKNWNLEENRSATRDTGLWIRTACNW